jgi:hypothetical protein
MWMGDDGWYPGEACSMLTHPFYGKAMIVLIDEHSIQAPWKVTWLEIITM